MTQTNVNVQMQIRRDTAANWQSSDPVLLAGEWGYITDTGKFKIGNGSTNFTFLPDAVLSTFGGTLTDHLKINNKKELRLSDSASGAEHYSSLKVGTQSENINYTLPTTAPTDNQYLKCSAAGVLSWDTFTGTDLADLVSNDANNRILTATGSTNSFNAEANLTFDGSTLSVSGSSQVIQTLTTTNSNGAYIEYKLGASGATIGFIGSAFQLVQGGLAANLAVRSQNLLQLCVGDSQKLSITSDKVQFNVDAKVDTDGQRDLGTSSNRWKNLYLSNDIEVGGNVGIGVSGSNISGTLHVHKSSGVNRSFFESGDNHTFLRLLGGTAANNSGIEFFSGSSANKANITARGDTSSLEFEIGNLSPAVEMKDSGNVEINDGNLELASTHGIHFHNYGSGTNVDSNLLDDYETGTWTPDIRFGTNQSTANQCTYSSRSGKYTKVGRVVTIEAFYNISNFNSNTGNMFLFGLPFTPASGCQSIMHHIGDGFNFGSNEFGTTFVLIDASNDRGIMGWQRETGWHNMTHSEMESGGMYITGVYYA
tara:strand:- start:682 stop:2295 length:1614 start_codon:yes stop_codon:yes gene_type:complete